MPGVPSSGSCDACRKQKKKCDKAQPKCSRCSRLGIACHGAGLQRFKFMTVQGNRDHGSTRLVAFPTNQPPSSLTPLSYNVTTALTAAFSHQLDVEDVRYNLGFIYGPLLREIPRRLGENAVLDASVSTLVATINDLTAERCSRERFRLYGTALSKLRGALQDPNLAYSSLTMCGIFIIWICQGWLGSEQSEASGHSAGLLAFISRSQLRFSEDLFDRQLLATLLGSITFEAAYDPSIKMTPWMKELLNGQSTDHFTISSCLLNFQNLMQNDPTLLPTINKFYMTILEKCKIPENVNMGTVSFPTSHLAEQKRFAAFSSLALNAGVAIALNGILRAYHPTDPELLDTCQDLHDKIINLARHSGQWLPLGACWVPIALEFAWTAQPDPLRRAAIQEAWEQHWTPVSAAPFNVSPTFAHAFDTLRAHASLQRIEPFI